MKAERSSNNNALYMKNIMSFILNASCIIEYLERTSVRQT